MKEITWEQLAIEYLDAAEGDLFARYTERDYERMAVWVKTEYGIPEGGQWSSYCKSKQARQMRGAIRRLRAKQYRAMLIAAETAIEREKCVASSDDS